jgi:hypothetical protein
VYVCMYVCMSLLHTVHVLIHTSIYVYICIYIYIYVYIHCIALHCTVLHCITLHYNTYVPMYVRTYTHIHTLHYTTFHYIIYIYMLYVYMYVYLYILQGVANGAVSINLTFIGRSSCAWESDQGGTRNPQTSSVATWWLTKKMCVLHALSVKTGKAAWWLSPTALKNDGLRKCWDDFPFPNGKS